MKLSLACLALVASSSAFAPSAKNHVIAPSTALHMSGVERNANFAKLAGGYLFPEIGRRRTAYLEANPEMADRIISLGIGDTTQPIPPHILSGLVEGASKLGSKEGYSGYGAEQGMQALREKIADKLYNGMIDADEVFVSDGAKCDIMRLQQMFGPNVVSAVQDPSYPVYVDTR
jgi:LL-diaminopimelate aminotransferase